MTQALKLLLLAGTIEAQELAQHLALRDADIRSVVSEPSRLPRQTGAMPPRHPFATLPEAVACMTGCDAVLDASHGFDGQMTTIGFAAAGALGLPFLSFVRPNWQAEEDPRWHSVASIAAGLPLMVPGARVFCTTGWGSLAEYAGFAGARLLLRQTTRHDRQPPLDFVDPVFGDPPFDEASEFALFHALQADTLICRNIGGTASRPKLDAAKRLNLQVILIDRPALPAGVQTVSRIADALDWVAAL